MSKGSSRGRHPKEIVALLLCHGRGGRPRGFRSERSRGGHGAGNVGPRRTRGELCNCVGRSGPKRKVSRVQRFPFPPWVPNALTNYPRLYSMSSLPPLFLDLGNVTCRRLSLTYTLLLPVQLQSILLLFYVSVLIFIALKYERMSIYVKCDALIF